MLHYLTHEANSPSLSEVCDITNWGAVFNSAVATVGDEISGTAPPTPNIASSWLPSIFFPPICQNEKNHECYKLLRYSARFQAVKRFYYIPRLSLNKMGIAIGWFLVMCPWSNSNVSWPGYNCAIVVCVPNTTACFCHCLRESLNM